MEHNSPMLPLVQGTGTTLGLCQESNSTRKMTFAGQARGFCSAKADGQHPWEEAATAAQSRFTGGTASDAFSDRNSKLVLFHRGLTPPEEACLGDPVSQGI